MALTQPCDYCFNKLYILHAVNRLRVKNEYIRNMYCTYTLCFKIFINESCLLTNRKKKIMLEFNQKRYTPTPRRSQMIGLQDIKATLLL